VSWIFPLFKGGRREAGEKKCSRKRSREGDEGVKKSDPFTLLRGCGEGEEKKATE